MIALPHSSIESLGRVGRDRFIDGRPADFSLATLSLMVAQHLVIVLEIVERADRLAVAWNNDCIRIHRSDDPRRAAIVPSMLPPVE